MTYPVRVLSIGLFQKRLAARRAGRPCGRRCERIDIMDTEKRATGATADETAGSELNERRIANKLAIVGVSGNVALSAF